MARLLLSDALIELDGGIVIIQRSNPPFGWALPGGFVDYGESLEDAVRRETKEETGLDIVRLKQFHTILNPTVTRAFILSGRLCRRNIRKPKAGDDAAG